MSSRSVREVPPCTGQPAHRAGTVKTATFQAGPATAVDSRTSAFPDMCFTPAPGTPLYECDKRYWQIVLGLCCTVCGQPIGHNVYMLTWTKDRRAHLSCWEERTEAEAKAADDPWLSEVSATRLKMTIGGFRELPRYQRGHENAISATSANQKPGDATKP